MGKEKVMEKTHEEIVKNSGLILQYAPLVLALISLVICYLLFKKIQILNSQNDSIMNIEKQFIHFAKEQSELNSINTKKYNTLISQMNQIGYVVQNNIVEQPKINSIQKSEKSEKSENNKTEFEQPKQREMIHTSVIQTNFPTTMLDNSLPAPISTTNKKEKENIVKSGNKKVLDLQKNEAIFEEIVAEDN